MAAERGLGGIGLGLAEPDLRVVYIVAGGAAAHCRGFFDVGDCVVGVDNASVISLRLKEVSVGTFCVLRVPSGCHFLRARPRITPRRPSMLVAMIATQAWCGLLSAGAHHWASRHRRQNHHLKGRDGLDQVRSADAAWRDQHESSPADPPADLISACMCADRFTWA